MCISRHGLHFCANLVCEPRGTGAAVLLRAVEPLAGQAQMRALRGGRAERELTNGPGKLAQAFAITLADDGGSALRGSLRIEACPDARPPAIETSPRIGLGKGVELAVSLLRARQSLGLAQVCHCWPIGVTCPYPTRPCRTGGSPRSRSAR